jgi:peptide/nickel transport system substrate-binding protein
MWTQEDAIQTRTGYLQERVDHFEIIDDQQIVMRLKIPDMGMVDIMSEFKHISMLSKAQWDAEGDEGVEARPAGTGPWQYVTREEGAFVRYEAVENHWRKSPEFQEMELRWVPEDATRLAMLLANESHIADVPRALEGQGLSRGMKKLQGTMPGIQTVIYFGGLFFATPEKFNPDVPWTKPEVREAMNRAINREELNQTVFGGDGQPVHVYDFHPLMAPVNPRWAEEFDEKYGYDPDKARELLAQAGYPNGFQVKLFTGFKLSGFPEINEVTEAVDLYWRDIGLDVELVSVGFAHIRGLYRVKIITSTFLPTGAQCKT